MHIFIVQHIDLDFRSMRYIKIDIIIIIQAPVCAIISNKDPIIVKRMLLNSGECARHKSEIQANCSGKGARLKSSNLHLCSLV